MPNLDLIVATDKKLPPAEVPEQLLFAMLQRVRAPLVAFLDKIHREHSVDNVLRDVMRIALRSPEFEITGWRLDAPGYFVSQRAELKLDVQAAEVLWRDSSVLPIPYSITQFSDYAALFSREALHCGMVARQRHRVWIHLIGTPFDLMEWDEPPSTDLGVGCPTKPAVLASAGASGSGGDTVPPARRDAALVLVGLGYDLERCIAALKETGVESAFLGNRGGLFVLVDAPSITA